MNAGVFGATYIFLVFLCGVLYNEFEVDEKEYTMEIKEQIEKMAKKVLSDEKLMDLFKKDPVKAVEKILGVDLPDDIIEKVVTGVKAQITVDTAKDVMGALKKLF